MLHTLRRWLSPKAAIAPQQNLPQTIDAYKRVRPPTPQELMAELKNTAWACASINAAVCANHPPALYVATLPGQAAPKCLTKRLSAKTEGRLREHPGLAHHHRKAIQIEEVLVHPLLTLLEQVNEFHNAFDLWELTTLYQEVHGCAYWLIEDGPLGTPQKIWILPTQNVQPYRTPGSGNIIDCYRYRTNQGEVELSLDDVIVFRYPDPRDPYTAGLSPLRACYEQVALTSDYAAMKKAIYDNRGIPSAIVSPEEAISQDERDQYEMRWNQKFRRGGSGKVLVADSKMNVHLLQQSMGDLAQLAEIRATMEDICNAFHVPIAYMTTNVNMANLQAAERQHLKNAIRPRLTRRDQKLNEQLIPRYDPSGRLFVASEDPTPMDTEADSHRLSIEMMNGILTINEARAQRNLPPVTWGDKPWLPNHLAQPAS